MKNSISRRLLALLLLFVLSINCKKDSQGGSDNNSNGEQGFAPQPTPVIASVQGRVIGEDNLPIVGAVVKSGTNQTVTDAKGFFFFRSIGLDRYTSYITVEKTGFWKGMRNFSIKAGATGFIKIKLLTKYHLTPISATTGGLVPLSSTYNIYILPNSVVNKNTNQPYSGNINVFATTIDPTAEDISERIPGGLRAIDSSGKSVLLRSFGMMGIELEGQNGEPLQIAPGKKAIIRFGIPAAMQANAPTMIPLWWMDETKGLWKEEGYAIKNSTFYEGDVTHFTFWNVDALSSYVSLDLTLKTPQGKVLPFTAVTISRVLMQGGETGWTDSLGNVSGLVPWNEPLKLTVKNNCRQAIYTYDLQPLQKNTSLGTITVSLPTQFSMDITGTLVNCNNQPISKGNAMISFEEQYYTVPVDATGKFSATITRCASSAVLEVIALDSASHQQSSPYQFSVANGSINTGNIKTCGGSSDSWFNYSIDGTPYTISTALGDTSLYGNANDCQMCTWIPSVEGQSISNPNVKISIIFGSGTTNIGDQEVIGFSVNNLKNINYDQYQKVHITKFGPVGDFIEGTFDVLIVEQSTTWHSIKGNFRIKRYPSPGP